MDRAPFRCGSCGARFVDEAPSPRCPKCLKRSLVERVDGVAAASPPPDPHPAAPRSPEDSHPRPLSQGERGGEGDEHDDEQDDDRRAGRALMFATVPPVLAALLVSGWLGTRVDPTIALLVAIGAAPITGFLVAKDWPGRIFASIASMIAAVGIVLATTWYVRGRSHLINAELLMPMVGGGLPGLALFYGLRALRPIPLLRALLAVGAVVVAMVIVVSC